MTPEQTLDWLAQEHQYQCKEVRPIQDWIRQMKSQLPKHQWKQYTLTQTIDMHRDGWLGAWDALVAAITKRPRFAVAQPVTLSFWAKGEPEFSLTQTQLEKQ